MPENAKQQAMAFQKNPPPEPSCAIQVTDSSVCLALGMYFRLGRDGLFRVETDHSACNPELFADLHLAQAKVRGRGRVESLKCSSFAVAPDQRRFAPGNGKAKDITKRQGDCSYHVHCLLIRGTNEVVHTHACWRTIGLRRPRCRSKRR